MVVGKRCRGVNFNKNLLSNNTPKSSTENPYVIKLREIFTIFFEYLMKTPLIRFTVKIYPKSFPELKRIKLIENTKSFSENH
jgi:hypothetical protein